MNGSLKIYNFLLNVDSFFFLDKFIKNMLDFFSLKQKDIKKSGYLRCQRSCSW